MIDDSIYKQLTPNPTEPEKPKYGKGKYPRTAKHRKKQATGVVVAGLDIGFSNDTVDCKTDNLIKLLQSGVINGNKLMEMLGL